MAYRDKDKEKEWYKSYWNSEKYKTKSIEKCKLYNKSEKGKASAKVYSKSEKYKYAHNERSKARSKSENGVVAKYCLRKLNCKSSDLSQEMKDAIYALYKLNCAIRNARKGIINE